MGLVVVLGHFLCCGGGFAYSMAGYSKINGSSNACGRRGCIRPKINDKIEQTDKTS